MNKFSGFLVCLFVLLVQINHYADAQETSDKVNLKAIADYMSNLTQGFARFEQLNADGTVSKGTLLVKRPSYARIEYDLPSTGLIIADRFRVAVFDLKSNLAPVIVPLSSTPLYVLLKDNIRIDDPGILGAYDIGNAMSQVTVKNASSSDHGSVQLIFENNPIRLAGWLYKDQFGQTTQMKFNTLIPSTQIDQELFDIDGEIRRLKK